MLLLAALQQWPWTAVTALQTYGINWAAVRAASASPSSKNLTANCVCDLTAFSCDVNCCCDADCVTPVVNSTSQQDRCLAAGPPAETLDYCIAKSSVSRVRVGSGLGIVHVCVWGEGGRERFRCQLQKKK
jgi:hypothetical protein